MILFQYIWYNRDDRRDTGEKKVFDVMPYIKGSWYEKLKVPAVFQTVHVSGATVAWADGQDIAPHELYDDSVPAV